MFMKHCPESMHIHSCRQNSLGSCSDSTTGFGSRMASLSKEPCSSFLWGHGWHLMCLLTTSCTTCSHSMDVPLSWVFVVWVSGSYSPSHPPLKDEPPPHWRCILSSQGDWRASVVPSDAAVPLFSFPMLVVMGGALATANSHPKVCTHVTCVCMQPQEKRSKCRPPKE